MTEPVTKNSNKIALSPAEKTGLAAFAAAAVLVFLHPLPAAGVLIAFVGCCLIAPFMPRVGFFLPVISKGNTGGRAVALTFDDGPDPETTPKILRLLQASDVKATFFVTGRKAADHPHLIRRILSEGHDIGNHSHSHDNLIMLKPTWALKREIQAAQSVLDRFGIQAMAFRPPVGVTNPGLGPILRDLGMVVVNFSCRGWDRGNRRIQGLSRRILRRVRPDDILVLHDTLPEDAADGKRLEFEVAAILSGLKDMGFEILPLRELIGRPIMHEKPCSTA